MKTPTRMLMMQADEIEAALTDASRLASVGEWAGAEASLKRASLTYPDEWRVWAMLAHVERATGNRIDAKVHFCKAIALDPAAASPQFDLAAMLMEAGAFAEAMPLLRNVIELEPDFPDAWVQLAVALRGTPGDHTAEIGRFLARAVELDPDHLDARLQLAGVLLAGPRADDAEGHLRHAETLVEDEGPFSSLRVLFHCCKATLHDLRREPLAALAELDLATTADPREPKVHVLRARQLLLAADFRRGWPEHEWRWDVPPYDRVRRDGLRGPQWDGSPLSGRTVLLYAEQGLGDSVQFARYVPEVIARGGRVVLRCHPFLHDLLATVAAGIEFNPVGEPLPPHDTHCPLMSLPLACATTEEDSIPRRVPYLSAFAGRVATWRTRIEALAGLGGNSERLRIGLVWAGSPAHPNDANRSIPLATFAPLWDVPGVSFFSLQKGPAVAQITSFEMPLFDVGSGLDDLADTAAVLSQMDLLVTVDTAPAHVAGALARPTWVLLPDPPDWRWQRRRTDSPWYPTMRLFRRETSGDWGPVVRAVATELHKLR